MKKYFAPLGVVLWFSLWGAWKAKDDYGWAEKVTAPKIREGWVVATTQNNAAAITHPWTMFKPPIVRVAMFKPRAVKRFGEGIVGGDLLWLSNVSFSSTSEDTFTNLVNCETGESATLPSESQLDSIHDLEWRKDEPKTPGEAVNIALCKELARL